VDDSEPRQLHYTKGCWSVDIMGIKNLGAGALTPWVAGWV